MIGAMRAGALAAIALAAPFFSACSSPEPPADPVGCTGGFLGSKSSPIELELQAANSDYQTATLDDGGALPLLIPPQGGWVMFVGVRATNIDSCGIQLTGALRDEATQQVRPDSRTVNLIPTGDGWGVTGVVGMPTSGTIANFANIPACPNQWASTDLYGHTYGLEVTVVDRGGRTATKKIQVTPACPDSPPSALADCLCTCRAGYVLGSTCPVDAGAPDPDAAGPDDGGAE